MGYVKNLKDRIKKLEEELEESQIECNILKAANETQCRTIRKLRAELKDNAESVKALLESRDRYYIDVNLPCNDDITRFSVYDEAYIENFLRDFARNK